MHDSTLELFCLRNISGEIGVAIAKTWVNDPLPLVERDVCFCIDVSFLLYTVMHRCHCCQQMFRNTTGAGKARKTSMAKIRNKQSQRTPKVVRKQMVCQDQPPNVF